MPFFEVSTGIPPRIVVEAESQMEAGEFSKRLFAKLQRIFLPDYFLDRLVCRCGEVIYDLHEPDRPYRYLLVFDAAGNFRFLCAACTERDGILDEIHARHHRSEDVDPHEIAMNPDGTGG